MSVKIQLASLSALERLIGGDTDIEVEIRQSVAENFAKKHLKTIASNEVLKAKENTVITAVREELLTPSGKDYWGNVKYSIKGEMYEKIKEIVNDQISSVAHEVIKEVLDINALKEKLKLASDKCIANLESEWNSEKMQQKIDTEVDRKIKSKLGLK